DVGGVGPGQIPREGDWPVALSRHRNHDTPLAAKAAIEPHSAAAQREETMSKKQISSEKIAKPNGHFSQATMIEARGRMVFISGMTARRPDGTIAGIGDIEAQTRQVCENVKAAVEAAGGTMDDICRGDVYVRNL